MIDRDLLRQVGWSEDFIDEVLLEAADLREVASMIPEMDDEGFVLLASVEASSFLDPADVVLDTSTQARFQ